MRFRQCLLFAGLVVTLHRPGLAVEAERDLADEQTLQAASLSTDGPALLEFFRKRSLAGADRGELVTLIRQLTDPSFEVREKATAELVAHGIVAVPLLRQAAQDQDDREVARRARRCLQFIEGDTSAAVPAAAARLLARRKPAGAADALLAYLPYADDDMVLKEVHTALSAVAFRDGKPEPALLRAVQDPVALRRAVAAETLVGSGGFEQWALVRGLLQDPKPMVRLRVALALGAVRSEEAVPVLIALLCELPPEPARQAEEYLINLAGDQAPKVPLGTDAAAHEKCRDAWAGWWRKSEGLALLDEIRKRTLTDAQRDKILRLIRQLGDESFPVREKATAEILAVGKTAIFLLRQAILDGDPEISKRALKCLHVLDNSNQPNVPAVAARLVALRKPPGAAEVLLAYLPYAEDDITAQEVQTALVALAFRDGKADPVLIGALTDKEPQRRAAAAEALCQAGGPEQWPSLRKFLKDSDAAVRLRVSLALAIAGDKEAIAPLIVLLGELPADQVWRAEDCLYRLFGEQGPKVPLGSDAPARQKCRDAWAAWWKEHGPRTELVKLDPTQRLLGYTLIVQMDNNGTGRVLELGAGGKPRWQIDGLQYAVDAQVLPGNRVLIAEYNGMRVTERDFKGTILWQHQTVNSQPVNAQRLPNGNTFIATEEQFLELDRSGKEIFSHHRPNFDILMASKSRNGHIHCITNRGTYVRLDAAGREVKTFSVGRVNFTSGFDVLPNGRVLVPQYGSNKVIEFDPDGKQVWEASVSMPNSATRLPNGHTLVASNNSQRLVELDRAGKVVWEYKDGNRPWRARRR